MIRYSVLTSGSCGNCYVFYDGKDSILIDIGLTLTGLKKRLEIVNVPFDSLRGLFITHMHPDHSKGMGVFYRATHLPVYLSQIARAHEEKALLRLGLDDDKIKLFNFGDTICCGSFTLYPFKTSHDSAGSCGYEIVHESGERIFLMTDTGVYSEESMAIAARAKLIFLESNYDEKMLKNGPYPYYLQQRVRGERGHLSNDQAMKFLSSFSLSGKEIYFVHVSNNNNTVELVNNIAFMSHPEMSYTVCERGKLYEGYL
ncbi:MAG: MBL fold metallo-hydrolase [Sphaerochaetaceae bacterium]|nr:MBL fold metallo-hydrolase [Sphaerochaetaceae bacterium]